MPIVVVLPAFACQAAMRLVSAPESPQATPSPILLQDDAVPSCPNETGLILREANTETPIISHFPSVDTNNNLYLPLVTYKINGDILSAPSFEEVPRNLLKYQQDLSIQNSAWQLFTELIPKQQRSMLTEFEIMTDGPGGVLSAVEQTQDDPHSWILETDIADIPDTKNLVFTLLHEFGHLLTLGPSQVPPDDQLFQHPYSTRLRDQAIAACSNYFPGEGCSLPTSYVNVFYGRFWKNLYDEWHAIDRIDDDNRREAELRSFYRKYRDQFVDSYAVTSPVEDIAESWAYYVLSPRPKGTSAGNQKLAFFSGYPELITLRAQILSNLCRLNP